MFRLFKIYAFLLFVALMGGCKKDSDETMFRLVSPEDSGIDFSNDITENDTINILKLEYIYNGGAVAAGDFNNDGLTDIFFSGNQVPNKLYLNKGDLKFQDISAQAGVNGNLERWRAGTALADVNNDGLLDIYLCSTLNSDSISRANILYVNKGLTAEGIPIFTDEAVKYGIADKGHSQHAAFLDYDRDGDLDLYILTNTQLAQAPSAFRKKISDGSSSTTDKLYRNNGNNTFSNVSDEAGITLEGYGLGLAIADVNNDQWPDIYVGNDYLTNDILYINNRNGTFSNKISDYIKHQSQFSMGNDVADINNDGLPDIITLDMLPATNMRRKTVISGGSYATYINFEKFGYEHQYVRNMLHVNNGNGTFSEIGQLAGVHQTEWSWAPLMADFDNDGYRDILISNGFPKDVTDKDFGNFRNGPGGSVSTVDMMIDSIPVVKVSNYAYKNNGNLTFTDVTKSWGMFDPAFSNGAAFADLDNDGDLDYVVNNINRKAFLYENRLYKDKQAASKNVNFLRIKLKGSNGNASAFGTQIKLHYGNGKLQYHDHSIYRGFLSTVEDVIHFGTGSASMIDTLEVRWPDGKMGVLTQVKCNQILLLQQPDATTENDYVRSRPFVDARFKHEVAKINFKHKEADKIDFNIQRTLPHKFSQYGPGVAVADVDGDGLDDVYLSGAAGNNGTFALQNAQGEFTMREHKLDSIKSWEDLGVLLFDADNDGDNDLYTVSGSIEWQPDSENYRDRLYINDGKGNFSEDRNALPDLYTSGSCVRAADYDSDGDLDLFIGGRVVPGRYPLAAESYILINHNGSFDNVTESICNELKVVGMVTDALWSDFDNDGKVDLVIARELMPVAFFKNTPNGFINVTVEAGISTYSGWWNSITSGDYDRDGDIDFAIGNLGLNNYYKASAERPVKVVAKDFDGNGSIDPIIACYFKMEDGSTKLCPVHFWDELNSLSPKFRRQFSRYKQYGNATLEDLLSPADMEGALVLEANYPASAFFENLGNGKFEIRQLPVEAQVSIVNGMISEDYNGDGNLDILLIGNDYGNEVFSGRLDASIGLLLQGDGKGNFKSKKALESGFAVDGDAKALASLYGKENKEIIIATQNRDSIKCFTKPHHEIVFTPKPLDHSVELVFENNRRQKVELYYGSGFISQSSRKIRIPKGTKEIVITDSRNQKRTMSYHDLENFSLSIE